MANVGLQVSNIHDYRYNFTESSESVVWYNWKNNAASCIEQVLMVKPHKTAAIRPPTIHHENYLS